VERGEGRGKWEEGRAERVGEEGRGMSGEERAKRNERRGENGERERGEGRGQRGEEGEEGRGGEEGEEGKKKGASSMLRLRVLSGFALTTIRPPVSSLTMGSSLTRARERNAFPPPLPPPLAPPPLPPPLAPPPLPLASPLSLPLPPLFSPLPFLSPLLEICIACARVAGSLLNLFPSLLFTPLFWSSRKREETGEGRWRRPAEGEMEG